MEASGVLEEIYLRFRCYCLAAAGGLPPTKRKAVVTVEFGRLFWERGDVHINVMAGSLYLILAVALWLKQPCLGKPIAATALLVTGLYCVISGILFTLKYGGGYTAICACSQPSADGSCSPPEGKLLAGDFLLASSLVVDSGSLGFSLSSRFSD